MASRRIERVQEAIKRVTSNIIREELRDPRIGFVTVTHVNVAPDLKVAYVYFSAMGDEKAKANSKSALERAKGFLQKEMARALKLRYTPKLEFRLDNSLDQGMEIDRVLRTIDDEKSNG